ncbi:MAG: bifunctional nicotinamidase/pyrazinamidase [Deltaproteobacteria bacterium]|nr:bifunctional nicotinamidase/pyrazinamidase [Deltaproteobacteria bacterium]
MMQLDIARDTDALLMVDLQPDFMPGGALAVAEGDRVVEPIAAIVPRFRTVVATQDWHPRGHVSFASAHGRRPYETLMVHGYEQTLWPDHCVKGSRGAAFHPAVPLEPVSMILRKGADPDIDSYSAFRENLGPDGTRRPTGLAGWLRERGIRRVFLCGLARDFCVLWSAEDAAAAGFDVVVLDPLTRAVFPERAAEANARFARAGARLVG